MRRFTILLLFMFSSTQLYAQTEAYTSPFWSPHGTQISYWHEGDLWVINADGTDERNLTADFDNVTSPGAWSPSGNRLAYRSGSDIWLVNADGTDRRNLSAEVEGDALGTLWSPDGLDLVFATETVLWRVSVADGTVQSLLTTADLPDAVEILPGCVGWSPDGRRFAFRSRSSMTGDGDVAIYDAWVLDLEDATLHPLPTEGSGCMQWATDNETLYYFARPVYGEPGAHIISIAVEDGETVTFTESFDAAGTVLSPDRRSLAYHLEFDTQAPVENEGDPPQLIFTFPSELIIHDTMTLTQTTIPVGDTLLDLTTDLAWSPDGAHLYFTGSCDETTSGLWSAEIETSSVARVVDCREGHVEGPQVSPDGRQVLFRADWAGGWDIYVVDIATASLRNLTGE
jgi:Tol biopolymer transport system component